MTGSGQLPNGKSRGRHRRALPLEPDRCASRPGVPRGQSPLPSDRAGSHVASEGKWRAGWGDVGPVGSSPPRHPRFTTNCPDVTVGAGASQEQYGSSASGRSGEVRCAAPARPPPVGPQDGLQRPAKDGQVPVVDVAVIQLTGEIAEQSRPVPAGRLEGDTNLNPPLHHLHRRPAGGRRAALLPGSVAAGGRAPLGNRTAAAPGDRSTAPPAGRRGSASFPPVRRGGRPVRTRVFFRGATLTLAALLLARPPSGAVLRGAAGSHVLSLLAILL